MLPLFLVAFVVLLALHSAGIIPPDAASVMSTASRWCLIIAIAALGVKTSFQQLAELGWRPCAMLVAETLFLATFILGGVAQPGVSGMARPGRAC